MRGPAVILTDQQRRALLLAANNETRVVLPGHPVGRREISYTVATTLLMATPKLLATVQRTEADPFTAAIVTITDHGRSRLAEPIPDTPRFLTWAAQPRGTETGYTDRAERGMGADEPEPVDAATQERITLGKLLTAEQRRRSEALTARHEMQTALARLERLGKDDKRIADRVRLIRRNIAAIDKLIRDDRAA